MNKKILFIGANGYMGHGMSLNLLKHNKLYVLANKKRNNVENLIKDGASAKIFISGKEQLANLVPLSILRLDDQGNLGVRLISSQGTVEFKKIDLIQDTKNGVWVSGLPSSSKIITVGQDYVNDGEKVNFALDQRLNPNEKLN